MLHSRMQPEKHPNIPDFATCNAASWDAAAALVVCHLQEWACVTSKDGLVSPPWMGLYHLQGWACVTAKDGLVSPPRMGLYHRQERVR